VNDSGGFRHCGRRMQLDTRARRRWRWGRGNPRTWVGNGGKARDGDKQRKRGSSMKGCRSALVASLRSDRMLVVLDSTSGNCDDVAVDGNAL